MFVPIPPLMPGATPEQQRKHQELLDQCEREMEIQFRITVAVFGAMVGGIGVFAVWWTGFA